ncbi:hypothetical protein WJX72_000456 [[Myrmecia] bisecta]|uniref:EF-hand domain-containing protein n=1 Tax=[Myrmecia] bisecta TaxID=41462 RepID=A0AAW1R4C7_9CHLO
MLPILKNLGFSGICGAASGVAFKAVGRACAVAVGCVFILIQGLAYAGYIQLDWTRVHADVMRTCDVNHDGRLDASDLKAALTSFLAVLSEGVPSAGGFCAGFIFGLHMG